MRPAARVAQQNIQYMQSAGIDTTGVQHLALYGTEGTAQAGNVPILTRLFRHLHAILIWIALLEDNGGVLDSQGISSVRTSSTQLQHILHPVPFAPCYDP